MLAITAPNYLITVLILSSNNSYLITLTLPLTTESNSIALIIIILA